VAFGLDIWNSLGAGGWGWTRPTARTHVYGSGSTARAHAQEAMTESTEWKLIAIAMNFFMKEIDDEIDDIVYVIITDNSHNEGI